MSRKIVTIDCDYLMPRFAAAFLIRDGDRAAFVENNTAHSVPRLLETLKKEGLRPEHVDFVIVTHVHLDHAGGTQALMDACPNAVLLAHPKAAPHLIDPSKLIASARQVYGDERFEKLYGSFGPIDAKRVRTPADDERVPFGSGHLRFLHTRGHAPHHFCVLWENERAIFTGDTFGLCYPDLQKKGLFVFPSTSPTGFEPEEALASVDRVRQSGATRAFLTHYGEVRELEAAAGQLREWIRFSADLLAEAVNRSESGSLLEKFCEKRIREAFEDKLGQTGLAREPGVWEILSLDLELNAQGIAFVAEKLRAKGGVKK